MSHSIVDAADQERSRRKDEAVPSAFAIKALACGIPDYMVGGIVRWIENGIHPGDFLAAVISNDLKEACARADETNQELIFNYVQFFYSWAPSQCWGSPEKVATWRGLGARPV